MDACWKQEGAFHGSAQKLPTLSEAFFIQAGVNDIHFEITIVFVTNNIWGNIKNYQENILSQW